MANLTVNKISRSGLLESLVAAAAGGDEFANTGKEFLKVKNADAAGITVTLDIETAVDGAAVVDPTVSVGAGEEKLIGPFPTRHYNNAANGRVSFTYSAVANVTVGAFQMAAE